MTPPKKTPDRREIYSDKRTPVGDRVVSGEIEDWSGDTDTHAKAGGDEEQTPKLGVPLPEVEPQVGRSSIARAQIRIKETKEIATATSAGVETLRLEMGAHVERLGEEIKDVKGTVAAQGEKIDVLGQHVMTSTQKFGDVQGALGKVEGTLTEVVKALDNRRVVEQTETASHTEIDKVTKITQIKDDEHKVMTRREIWSSYAKKAGVGLIAIASVIATHFAEKC